MAKRQLRIDLLGTSFVIQSEESPERLEQLSSYVKERIEEVKGRYSFAEPLTIAVLAALNIADELFKTREGRGQPAYPAEELASVAERIIGSIDDALLSHVPYEGEAHEAEGSAPASGQRPSQAPGPGPTARLS